MLTPLIPEGARPAGDHGNAQRIARRLRGSLALSAAVIVAALPGSALASATVLTAGQHTTTAQAPSAVTAQGIIMRDGGICDPIRHMGC